MEIVFEKRLPVYILIILSLREVLINSESRT